MNDVDEGGGQKDCQATGGTAGTVVADNECLTKVPGFALFVNGFGPSARGSWPRKIEVLRAGHSMLHHRFWHFVTSGHDELAGASFESNGTSDWG